MSADEAIRATNDDAAGCKRFAIEKGYWKDPYIHYFLPKSERKAPEISRGYFARITGISTLLNEFLKVCKDEPNCFDYCSTYGALLWDENLLCCII
jgi:[phosphatase 2A protein]-leucine-carboxy methyltransferase